MQGVANNSDKSFGKFILLWSGELISAIGSGLTAFGLGVYVFQQTGLASAMALVMLLAFLPALLLGPVAGVLADRYDRRLLMVLGDSLSVLGLGYILVCLLQGEAQLWQIGVGVTISSVFASLLEPAYKATVTDLLSEEQYTKASGLVQVAGAAKYLISPILAGFLLALADIKLLLLIDIGTFFVTAAVTLVVRSGLTARPYAPARQSFWGEMQAGWAAVSGKRGVLVLVLLGTLLTFSLGFIQTLSLPMLLAFTTPAVAGTIETLVAMGMLVSSLLLGVLTIKKGYVNLLALALLCAGGFMALFGLRENIVLIGIAGFLFFSTLPFANAGLDFLLRTNIDNAVQGRAWALIGLISQLGYVAAYGVAGLLADYVFTPMLLDGGLLAGSVGRITGTGSGRGTGLLIILAGWLLCATAVMIYNAASIRELENRGDKCFTEPSVMMF